MQSLKNFARLDGADSHEDLNSTLTLMNAELLERVTVNKRYGEISKIACNAGQLFRCCPQCAEKRDQRQGTIDVATFEENAQVHIEISDTGRGIPHHRLDRLFDFEFTGGGTRVKMSSGLSTAYSDPADETGAERSWPSLWIDR